MTTHDNRGLRGGDWDDSLPPAQNLKSGQKHTKLRQGCVDGSGQVLKAIHKLKLF